MFFIFVVFQVLATVKNQIEEEAARRKDFSELITAAQHWLLAREASSITAAGEDFFFLLFSFFLCLPSLKPVMSKRRESQHDSADTVLVLAERISRT